jgi:hypothetical protein
MISCGGGGIEIEIRLFVGWNYYDGDGGRSVWVVVDVFILKIVYCYCL